MKITKYNEISIYVNVILNFRGRDVKVIWTTEDGILKDYFYDAFKDLNEYDLEDAYEQFKDELPLFDLDVQGLDKLEETLAWT